MGVGGYDKGKPTTGITTPLFSKSGKGSLNTCICNIPCDNNVSCITHQTMTMPMPIQQTSWYLPGTCYQCQNICQFVFLSGFFPSLFCRGGRGVSYFVTFYIGPCYGEDISTCQVSCGSTLRRANYPSTWVKRVLTCTPLRPVPVTPNSL